MNCLVAGSNDFERSDIHAMRNNDKIFHESRTAVKNPYISCFDTAQAGASRLKKILLQDNKIVIATLGPEGTSSESAARVLADHGDGDAHCMLFATYEEAAQAVINRQADYLVVANAYHSINHFYISDSLVTAGVFPKETPPYGVAVRSGVSINKSAIILASHPAPSHMVESWFKLNQRPKLLHTNSTSAAAKMVAAGEVDACITTDPARQKNGLVFVTNTYRIRMIWSIFVRPKHLAAQCLFESSCYE